MKTVLKPKPCKQCKALFMPMSSWAKACSPICAMAIGRQDTAKKLAKAKAEDRKATKQELEKHKTRAKWFAETQTAFNAFIRARDYGLPCICCGKPMEPQRPGGSIDAGHYLTRGASKHLALDERNCHAQRKSCNRPGGAVRAAFRAGMINRIGLEALEALEADQEPRKYTIDDLKELKAHYVAKTKAILKGRS
jgi:hypothetical protein